MQNTYGYYKGKHYTKYVEEVQSLIRGNKLYEAERLLFALVDATENESIHEGFGVAPWYYERLAIIYRKRKDIDSEIGILERYASQKHAPGAKPPQLLVRLEKLKMSR